MDFINSLSADRRAKHFDACYPLGNGSLGAASDGGVKIQTVHFNHDTLWSGDGTTPHRQSDALPKIRRMMFDDDVEGAEDTLWHDMLGQFTESYLPMCDLTIKRGSVKKKGYFRTLDFAAAVHSFGTVGFSVKECVSHPDDCWFAHIESTAAHIFSLSSKLKTSTEYRVIEGGKRAEAVMKGVCPTHVDPVYHNTPEPIVYDEKRRGTTFEVALEVRTDGAVTASGDDIRVEGQTYIELILVCETSFENKGDLLAAITDKLASADKKSAQEIFAAHSADFSSLYNRVSVSIAGDGEEDGHTTLKALKSATSRTALPLALFNFGRYLMISGSRQGSMALNLQGIWNDSVRPPWSSNYTVNINTEMNYWGAEAVNLSECHEPLLRLVSKIADNGKLTAQKMFGLPGWHCGHNSDVWGHTDDVGGASDYNPSAFGLFVGGGGWLASHVWEHYLFTEDKDFLKKNFRLLENCCRFYLAYLCDDGNGNLIACPSSSPENSYIHASSGKHVSLDKASTIDMSIIRQSFRNLIAASRALGVTSDVATECAEALDKIYPLYITQEGTLGEWYGEWKETDIHHRHLSHLYGLHPYYEITPSSTPRLAEACKKSLEKRGDGGTGWSLAWKINMYSRLGMGDKALQLVRNQLNLVRHGAIRIGLIGGSYESLLCAHPPFQIDGNFGAMSGITEMLLQSHEGICLLPALPAAWTDGSFRGLRARGACSVDCEWKSGVVRRFRITADDGKDVQVKADGKVFAAPSGVWVTL